MVWKWQQGTEATYSTSRPVGGEVERKHTLLERAPEEASIC